MHETFDSSPPLNVADVEYHRLLGFPRGHVLEGRTLELALWAREWYAEHGRPWVYFREAALADDADALRIDGVAFESGQLRAHLRQHEAGSAVLVVASAGAECEEHARQLWEESRPDEYFFLEVYGSAVVEDLVARTSGRLCEKASARGLMAIPHYSPGYTGWDVADQNALFDLIAGGASAPLPGPIGVMSSGMLRPKKSLLAVFGLAPLKAGPTAPQASPCQRCSFSPCQYRRAAYRHAPAPEPLARHASYSTNTRALRKWAHERVRLDQRADGTLEAVFRFDGTTCSNMGRPLAFDYRILLSGPAERYRVIEASCSPAQGDEGYRHTCAYQSDPDSLLQALAAERPLVGRPLDDVFTWTRPAAPSGCHCTEGTRSHKWGIAYEAIHYALLQSRGTGADS